MTLLTFLVILKPLLIVVAVVLIALYCFARTHRQGPHDDLHR